nr:ac92-like protein [Menippe mercenaria nudivirus]
MNLINYTCVKQPLYRYDIIDPKQTFTAYLKSCSQFFAYLKVIKPDPRLVNFGDALNTYHNNWILLVSNILQSYDHSCAGFDNQNELIKTKICIPYDTVIERMALEQYTFNSVDGYKNIWGPVYWKFLHLTSILCKTSYQRSLFGANMMNFNLTLICGNCSANYKKKNPFVLMTILTLQDDCITPIFTLHNTVNAALNKTLFSFEDFLATYNLKAYENKILSINYIS